MTFRDEANYSGRKNGRLSSKLTRALTASILYQRVICMYAHLYTKGLHTKAFNDFTFKSTSQVACLVLKDKTLEAQTLGCWAPFTVRPLPDDAVAFDSSPRPGETGVFVARFWLPKTGNSVMTCRDRAAINKASPRVWRRYSPNTLTGIAFSSLSLRLTKGASDGIKVTRDLV